MDIPSEEQIQAKATEAGVDRKRAARILMDEQATTNPAPAGIELARASCAVSDGRLEIVLIHYPAGEPRE